MSLPAPYYQDDNCTIYHGDCLELLPEIRAASIDLVLTDPPYIIGAVSSESESSKAGTWGDMMNSSRWFRDWYGMAQRVLRSSGALWTFCNWRSLPVVMKAAIDARWFVASLLVWHKDWIGPGGTVGLRPSYELAALLPMPDFAIPDRGLPDVWTVPWSSHKPNGHPAEKPEALMRKMIAAAASGGVILDPFMGSGTTLRAAADTNCKAIGIESEERYCEIAAKRMSQMVLPLTGD